MVEEEIPEEIEDEQEDQLEDSIERQQDIMEDYSAPTYKEKDDLFSLFWKVVLKTDSSKVGNLDPKIELGIPNMTVRDLQRVGLIGHTLGHPGFANFFRKQAEIVLSTSASKDGWLPELFVTQRKYSTKKKDMSANLPQFQPKKRKSILKWGS